MADITTAFRINNKVHVGNLKEGLKEVEDFRPIFSKQTDGMSLSHLYIVMLDTTVEPMKIYELEKIPLTAENGGPIDSKDVPTDDLVAISNRVLSKFHSVTTYH